jgi:hypothetical protein
MHYEVILQIIVQLFTVALAAWGVAGLIATLHCLLTKRSTLRAWWRGSTYFGPRSGLYHQFQ